MPPTASNDYDRVAYPTMAHPQTFAEFLSVKGFLRGLKVAPPGHCRVLELGCGDGFNLAAMAAVYPESSYVGIDYSAEAIERGRGFMSGLGLKQVRLETADIRSRHIRGRDRHEPALRGKSTCFCGHAPITPAPARTRQATNEADWYPR